MTEHEIRKAVAESQWGTHDRAWFMQALVNLLDEIDRLRAQPDLREAHAWRSLELYIRDAISIHVPPWCMTGVNESLARLSALRSAKSEGRME